jgi:hypothetical protein
VDIPPCKGQDRFIFIKSQEVQSMGNTLIAYAKSLVSAGFAVLPPKPRTKRPIENWGKYQDKAPSLAIVNLWYMSGDVTGIGFVCGKASGNLEVIDFDDIDAYKRCVAWIKDDPRADAVMKLITVIEEKSPKGIHWYYRVHNNSYPNQKLAMFRTEDGSLKCQIETPGEGGYIIAAPSEIAPGKEYIMTRGESHADIVTISCEQRNTLIDRIRSMSEENALVRLQPKEIYVAPEGADRPGDAYERQKSWEEILTAANWSIFSIKGEITQWCKPSAEDRHCHATTGKTSGFYVFSSNAAPFEPGRSYSKFAVYTLLTHNGNFSASAKALEEEGYGGGNIHRWQQPADPNTPIRDRMGCMYAHEFESKEYQPLEYIAYDILPEGLVLLAGAPKIGKSFMALDLALTACSGGKRKFLGKYTVPEDMECLYFAAEDVGRRIHDRILSFKENIPGWSEQRIITDNSKCTITCQPPRPLDKGFCNDLSEYLKAYPKTRLVIVDVYNCIKPSSVAGKSGGGNAYDIDARLAEPLQQLALAHRCCIMLIHHLRKQGINRGESSGDPFEEISGSMGLPSKADTIMVLKRGIHTNSATLYIRGRETQEQKIELEASNGLWYVKPELKDDEEVSRLKYGNDLLEYFEENGLKKDVTPGEFGRWYFARTGEKMSNPAQILGNMYKRNAIDKTNGRYRLLDVVKASKKHWQEDED